MTFDYVKELMEETICVVKFGNKDSTATATPPPLTASKRKPTQDEARQKLAMRRFKKFKKRSDL